MTAWAAQFGATTNTDDVTIAAGMDIEIAGPVTCRRLLVEEGATLRFAPDTSGELFLWANFELHGRLIMDPASFAVTHTVTFEGVNVEAFVGGGMAVVETDVGLWVREHGYLTVDGPYRKAWTRLAASHAAGQTVLAMEAEPSGWQPGDKIVVCPTDSITTVDWWDRFTEATVTAVAGNDVTITPPLARAHNVVDVGDGVIMRPEVLNLTRNAIIRGRPGAEAHIHFHVHTNNHNSIKQLQLDALGPRKAATPTYAEGEILGRYPIHFHHGFDGTRGTTLDSCVSTRSRNRAFVPHLAHGITFRGCVAYDTIDSPFWWDMDDDTNDIYFDRCVAAKVRARPWFRGYRIAGFDLRSGIGNRCEGCVAVGVQGNTNANGYHWPEMTSQNRLWPSFVDNVAHNNKVNGIFTWQNDSQLHVVDRFVAYHCGQAGIEHGAYNNDFEYRNTIIYGCRTPVVIHSHSAYGNQKFTRVHVRGAGVATYGFALARHVQAPPVGRSRVDGCTFDGYTVACFGPGSYNPDLAAGGTKEWLEVTNCEISGTAPEFLFNAVHPDSSIIVDNGDGAFEVRHTSSTGTLVPEWNARRTDIAAFAPAPPPAFEPYVFRPLPGPPNVAPIPVRVMLVRI